RNLFLDDEDLGATLMDFVRDLLTTDVQVTPNQSGFALLVFLVGATALGAYLFRRKEYVIS
ncbi:MAG: hypothetical protein HKO53_10165, partial [Gemmatimonadetes bacterium]|nr:hypothetical protein [Gemmatimonadota bacterium]